MGGTGPLSKLLEHVGMSEEQLNIPFSDDHLREASLFLTKREKLTPFLDLDEADAEVIEKDGKGEEDKKYKMLLRWKEKRAFEATYKELVSVLLHLGMASQAEKVCGLLQRIPHAAAQYASITTGQSTAAQYASTTTGQSTAAQYASITTGQSTAAQYASITTGQSTGQSTAAQYASITTGQSTAARSTVQSPTCTWPIQSDFVSCAKILLIGSTGHGKSTLGNFLLNPAEKYRTQRKLQFFQTATSPRPQTQCVQVKGNRKSNPTLYVIDTPGLNESGAKDLEHMVQLVRSLKQVRYINACILCITFNNVQYKATIAYYKKLLPRLFETNVLIVLTNCATDRRSVKMREKQGVTISGTIRTTIDEVITAGFVTYEPQVFTIDCLPVDLDDSDDNREQSEKIREAILSYIDTLPPVDVASLRVAKNAAIRQQDDLKMKVLGGEITGYSFRLKQCNKKAEEAFEEIEAKGKEKAQVDCELRRLEDKKGEIDTEDPVIAAVWHLNEERKFFQWQSEPFSCSSKPCPIIKYTMWDNGHLKWVLLKKRSNSISGKVEGEFCRGLYANITLKTYKREKYRKEIQKLNELIDEQKKKLTELKGDLGRIHMTHQQHHDDIKLLQDYIDEKSKAMEKLAPDYMSLEEAEEKLAL